MTYLLLALAGAALLASLVPHPASGLLRGGGVGIILALLGLQIPIDYTTLTGPGAERFWAMTEFLVVAGSLLFIARQIQLQRQANAITSLIALDSRWNSKKMHASRCAVCADQSVQSLDIDPHVGRILTFFEEMGLHLKRGLFDTWTVWEIYSYYVEH